MVKQICTIGGCESAQVAKSLCQKHYQRLKTHGSPYATKLHRDPIVCEGIDANAPSDMCGVIGCDRDAEVRNLCKAHYTRWRRGSLSPSIPVQIPLGTECSVYGCTNRPTAKQLCSTHYRRLQVHGSTLSDKPIGAANGDALRWIEGHLNCCGDDCLIWPYSRNEHGYGVVRYKERVYIASRLICELVHGPKPVDKLDAAHSCGNGHLGCVNPKHLFWMTRSENNLDRINHGTNTHGENNPRAILTEKQVLEIRQRALLGLETQKEIAADFDIQQSRVSLIKHGKSWKHLFA